jgi:hypothetical protein
MSTVPKNDTIRVECKEFALYESMHVLSGAYG